MPLSARSAASPSPDIWAMNAGREPTSPGLVKSRIAQRSPNPFSIGVPVSAMRDRAGMRRSCWEVSLVGFLIACASSSTIRRHSTASSASMSRTAVAYVVMTTSDVRAIRLKSSSSERAAPWCTTTRRLRCELRGLRAPSCRRRRPERRRAPVPHRRCGRGGRARSASCRAPCRGRGTRRARRHRGTRASRPPRPGTCAARRRTPPGARRARSRRCAAFSTMSIAQLSPWTTTPPARPPPSRPIWARRISAPVSVRDRLALLERRRGLLEVDPIDLDPPAARLHQRARLLGEPADVGRGQLDVVEQDRPRDVAELVRADHRAARRLGEQAQRRLRLASRQRRARARRNRTAAASVPARS